MCQDDELLYHLVELSIFQVKFPGVNFIKFANGGIFGKFLDLVNMCRWVDEQGYTMTVKFCAFTENACLELKLMAVELIFKQF